MKSIAVVLLIALTAILFGCTPRIIEPPDYQAPVDRTIEFSGLVKNPGVVNDIEQPLSISGVATYHFQGAMPGNVPLTPYSKGVHLSLEAEVTTPNSDEESWCLSCTTCDNVEILSEGRAKLCKGYECNEMKEGIMVFIDFYVTETEVTFSRAWLGNAD